jgi:hypothetical protein
VYIFVRVGRGRSVGTVAVRNRETSVMLRNRYITAPSFCTIFRKVEMFRLNLMYNRDCKGGQLGPKVSFWTPHVRSSSTNVTDIYRVVWDIKTLHRSKEVLMEYISIPRSREMNIQREFPAPSTHTHTHTHTQLYDRVSSLLTKRNRMYKCSVLVPHNKIKSFSFSRPLCLIFLHILTAS